MRDVHHPSGHPLVAGTLCAVAVVLIVVPAGVTEAVKAVFRDAAAPGATAIAASCTAAADLRARLFDRRELEERVAVLESQLVAERARARRLEIARAREADSSGADSPPLVVPDLLPARVLGAETAKAWRAGRLVDVGLGEGVREEAAVLADEGPLVDRGRDGGLDAGQFVLDGRTLVGRIRTVGRWTAVVQPITDPEYRVRVRIARRTSRGIVLGATGILRGTGDANCRLDYVGSTEAVAVEDEVYTDIRPSESDASAAAASAATDLGLLYVGRIVRAELPTGAPHWELEVAPASTEIPDRVGVLRRRFNPDRLLD